jgi:hypothetical protein
MPPYEFAITSSPTAIDAAERAIVYLTVDWSMPERHSREAIAAALAALEQLDFEFFSVSEDDELMRPWLRSHGFTEYRLGYGSLLWLERGHQVAKELLPGHVGSEVVVAKTRSLWGQSAT